MESFTLEQLAKLIGGTPLGSSDLKISHLQDSKVCDNGSICYVKDKKFIDSLSSEAGAVITTKDLAADIKATDFIIVDDPYLAYAKASKVFSVGYHQQNEKVETIFGDNVKTDVIGWIADEVQSVFPDAVMGTKDEVDSDGKPVYQSLTEGTFLPDAIQAIQKLIQKVETLEAKVASLEGS